MSSSRTAPAWGLAGALAAPVGGIFVLPVRFLSRATPQKEKSGND
jgi:hypothetical protein